MASIAVKKREGISGLTTFELPVPSTYDVIYGLAKGSREEIYLSVSAEFAPGVCACIYAFDRGRQTFQKVVDFEQTTGYDPHAGLMPHSKVHLSLNACPEGRVFAATHFTAPALGQKEFDPIEAYRGRFQGSFLVEYDSNSRAIVNHGCLLPGEGCRIATLDSNRRNIYLVSYPRNHLVQFHYPSRSLRDLGRLGQENSFGLEVDESGNVYTSDDFGRFVKFSLKDDCLQEMDCFVPLRSGRRRQGNYIRRMTKGCDGRFYGFGNKGVCLFSFSPAAQEVIDFGPILGHEAKLHYEYPLLPPAKALVQTDPRSLYVAFGGDGIYMDDDQVPSLVKYDLISRKAQDLGKFVSEDGTPAWIPQCALFCEDENAIYFGMQQAVEGLHLWKVSLSPLLNRTIPLRGEPPALKKHLEKVQAAPFGKSVEGKGRLPYVSEGHVAMVELGWFGEGSVIPPGESAISDLVFVKDTLYGITVGRRPHLFRYSPYQTNRFVENYDVHVCDLGILVEASATRARIFDWAGARRLVALVRTEGSLNGLGYDVALEHRTYRPHIHSVPHWSPFHSYSNPFRLLFTSIGPELPLRNLVFDQQGECIYTTDFLQQLTFLRLPGGEKTTISGIYASDNTFTLVGPDRFFAMSCEGEALIFDFSKVTAPTTIAKETRKFDFTCAAHWKKLRAVILGRDEGKLVVCDLAERTGLRILSLPNEWKVRGLASGPSGDMYGYYGKDDAIGEAFVLDAETLTVRELGILQVRSDPRFWINHRCDCMAAGRDGEVYFGEADRTSHLLTYYPPLALT